MNTIYKILSISFFFVLILTSCEDVIELDLATSAQQYVFDANLNATDSSCVVQLSKTANYYETNDFEAIEDATVVLNLSNGNNYTLTAGSAGQYSPPASRVRRASRHRFAHHLRQLAGVQHARLLLELRQRLAAASVWR